MKQKNVRWRRFTDTPYGAFCSLHKVISIGVLSIAMLASFDVKAGNGVMLAQNEQDRLVADSVEASMDSVVVECSQCPLQQANGARTETNPVIYGRLVDRQGRCVHYHSVLDVVANKCAICHKFYSCFKCHDKLESHSFGAVDPSQPFSVMCGVCGFQFSYNDYQLMNSRCSMCGAAFNPRCSNHKCIYSVTGGDR